MTPLSFEVFARTEVGCARERNEDSFVVAHLGTGESGLLPEGRVRTLEPPGTLIAVCDGMGGAAAGDVASRLALQLLEQVTRAHAPIVDLERAERCLLESVTGANRAIGDYAQRHPDKRGMGTTMTAALAFGPDVAIVQVGDSRAYLKRGPAMQQLTMDHNVVGQMIASGRIAPEDARNVRQRNMLLEAIGVQARVGPDLIRVRVQPGDVLMLCSDGLTGPLSDAQIRDVIDRYEDPVRVCRALTEAACAAGGPDNVTVVLARIIGDPQAAASDPIAFDRRAAVA